MLAIRRTARLVTVAAAAAGLTVAGLMAQASDSPPPAAPAAGPASPHSTVTRAHTN